MIGMKVQQILVENRHTGKLPRTMTDLAAGMGISERQLYQIFKDPKPADIERIARGLGVDPSILN